MTVFAMVCRFPSWSVLSHLGAGTLFPNSAQAGFGGFGLGLLVRLGFLGAKAPLQSVFAKDTAFFSAKAQKLQKAQLFAIVCRIFYGGILFWLWESKGNRAFKKARKNLLFQKQANFKGEAFWLPLQPWFAKDTAFFSAKAQNSGIRLSRIPGIICRFSLWNSAGCVRLWLGAFGK